MNPFLIAQGEGASSGGHSGTNDTGAHGVENVGTHGADGAGHGAEHAAEGSISIGEHWTANVAGSTIHVDTVLYSAIIMVLLLIVFAALGRTINPVPSEKSGTTGTILEGIVGFTEKIIHDFIGHNVRPYLWFVGSVFVFILAANWIALLPWRAFEAFFGKSLQGVLNANHAVTYHAPTADLNLTAGLALISLFLYWFFGIKENGIGGFLGHHWFAKPVALFPLRMLEDVTRPLSLALRLFANMTAGHVVGLVLLVFTYVIVPVVLLPLEMFVGAVQAFIFAALSASYIGAAVAHHDSH